MGRVIERAFFLSPVGKIFIFSKFRAGTTRADICFFLFLSLSLTHTHAHIERVETDDHTINEHCRDKCKPGFVRVVRRDELLLHKLPEGFRRNRTVCRSRGRES